MVVLVTGAAGQLGQALQYISGNFPQFEFVYCTSSELNIADLQNCESVFEKYHPHFCINAAAYTAVDKAESEPEKAYSINVTGAENLAKVCKKHNAVLLHVSTDFVFDGTKNSPYKEEDATNPLGVYGKTKLEGEQVIQKTWEKHIIVRTSWVYSQFGNNFYKTMLRLAKERDELSVVSDQIGCPTNAVDLAEFLIRIIVKVNTVSSAEIGVLFGTYHFSGDEVMSWFDFALKIFKENNVQITVHPIPTSAYPTPAKRPAYSVMDTYKAKTVFEIKN
ncbi:dTDP-4-dehydrorhamnose reductase [Flavobacterium sp. SM15]|uniref:dTDP-4-dehydrorhamnose reductase n=1 Tax=Flavobacterium sp. SM15 TaxID=2908005 RepID=UPI001EDC36E5|nr:dTDP-4-dehydrorhamnose reductase [Flavobacterium sp. SM15]MCG2610372.1 dTDP-4-dehydrorhamnose reductase [Flavobacterium sp. SM15]